MIQAPFKESILIDRHQGEKMLMFDIIIIFNNILININYKRVKPRAQLVLNIILLTHSKCPDRNFLLSDISLSHVAPQYLKLKGSH